MLHSFILSSSFVIVVFLFNFDIAHSLKHSILVSHNYKFHHPITTGRTTQHAKSNAININKSLVSIAPAEKYHYNEEQYSLRLSSSLIVAGDEKRRRLLIQTIMSQLMSTVVVSSRCDSGTRFVLPIQEEAWTAEDVFMQQASATNTNDNSKSHSRKPSASLENLLPPTRVKILIDRAVETAHALLELLDPKAKTTRHVQAEEELLLSELKQLLYNDQEEFFKTKVEKEKSKLRLKTISTSQDLYRSQVLACMEDAKAELQYRLKQADINFHTNHKEKYVVVSLDATELLAILEEAQSHCAQWFKFIP